MNESPDANAVNIALIMRDLTDVAKRLKELELLDRHESISFSTDISDLKRHIQTVLREIDKLETRIARLEGILMREPLPENPHREDVLERTDAAE